MNTKEIQNRIDQIGKDWDEDSKSYYYDILYQLNEYRPIQNFNLAINIGDNPENFTSNITLVLFESVRIPPVFENKSILEFLGDGDIITKKFIDQDTLYINFDF